MFVLPHSSQKHNNCPHKTFLCLFFRIFGRCLLKLLGNQRLPDSRSQLQLVPPQGSSHCGTNAPSCHPGPPDLVSWSDLRSPSTATPPPFPECLLPCSLTTLWHISTASKGPQPCSSSRRQPPSCVSLVCRGCGCRSVMGGCTGLGSSKAAALRAGSERVNYGARRAQSWYSLAMQPEALHLLPSTHLQSQHSPYRFMGELAWCTELKRNKTLSQIQWNLRTKHNCIL